jgi:hypothetical protein
LHKRGLFIGTAMLVAASTATTFYLVNHPLRPKEAGVVEVGANEPQQVLSPSEILVPLSPESAAELQSAGTTQTTDTEQSEQTDESARILASFAPPGNKVAYPDWKTGQFQVREARAVTGEGLYWLPKWSPVGLDIAFTDGARNAIFIAGAMPGGAVRELVSGASIGSDFRWNMDGMSLRVKAPDGQFDDVLITGERYPAPPLTDRLIVRDDRIYYFASPGPPLAKAVLVSGVQDRFSGPILSPDESRTVYHGAQTGLFISAVDGSRALCVGEGANPTWLPDSSGIVYDMPVSDGRAIVGGDLCIAMADGSYRANLTQTPGIVESCPSVAPDGERIAFVASGVIYVGKLIRPDQGNAAKQP